MFKPMSLTLAISFIGFANAAERNPRSIEDCLTGIGDNFSIAYQNLTRESIYLQQDISRLETSSTSARVILPSRSELNHMPSIDPAEIQTPKTDSFLIFLDGIQAKILNILSNLQEENTASRRYRDQLVSANQDKAKQTKEDSKLEQAPKFEQAPKLIRIPTLTSIQEDSAKRLHSIIVTNEKLKIQLPKTVALPESAPLDLPAFPNREDYLTSSDYVGAIFDTLQARIMGRFSIFQHENEVIRKLIASNQPTSSKARELLKEAKPFKQEMRSVTTYQAVEPSSSSTASSVVFDISKNPPLPVGPDIIVRHPSSDTRRTTPPSSGRSTPQPVPSSTKSPARNSSRSSIMQDSELFKYQLKLAEKIVTIITENQNLKDLFEKKFLQLYIEPEFIAASKRQDLLKQLNDAAKQGDPAGNIQNILTAEVSSPLAHRKDRKGREQIEAQIETERAKTTQATEAAEREKDIQRVLDKIPSSAKSSDDADLKKKVTQVVEGYKSGAIAIIQAGSEDSLDPLIHSLKSAVTAEAVTKILNSSINLITQNLERKEKVDQSTITRDFVLRGTFTHVPGIISLNGEKPHGVNLLKFDAHFYDHLKYQHPNTQVESKLSELSQSPHSGLFVSDHIHVDSTDPFGIKHRLLILKTKHLAYIPSCWPATSRTLIPEHYIYVFHYHKMRVLQDQYEKLLQYTTPPHQLWHFPGVGVFAIDGYDIVSFNIGNESMISGHDITHFKRARILGTKDKVFNSELNDD